MVRIFFFYLNIRQCNRTTPIREKVIRKCFFSGIVTRHYSIPSTRDCSDLEIPEKDGKHPPERGLDQRLLLESQKIRKNKDYDKEKRCKVNVTYKRDKTCLFMGDKETIRSHIHIQDCFFVEELLPWSSYFSDIKVSYHTWWSARDF